MSNGNARKIATVFGSAHPREDDEEYRFAYEVGKNLALNDFTVCNGGCTKTQNPRA
jgi:predicted Rossmann-fold nucleotide-binding protein